jgi:hypothetical protein
MTNRGRPFLMLMASGGAAPDVTRPTVAITSAASGTTPGAFTCTFTFSEDVTGFVVGDITCSANAGAGTFNAVSASVYTAVITPTTLDTVTVDVAEGVAEDAAANTNTAATQFSIINTSVTAPAITPTLGAEALANAGFEGTYDDESGGGGGTVNVAPSWNNSGCETDGTDTLDSEGTTVHGGSAAQKIIANAANEGVITAANSAPAKAWFQVSYWAYPNSGTVGGLASNTILPTVSAAGAWSQGIATGRGGSFASTLRISSSSGAFNGFIDDASIKLIDVASMVSLLGSLSGRNGAYICTPTVTAFTQCGIDVAYLNASNFARVYVDRTSASAATANLVKFISGNTWTSVISGAITYGATKELKVIISGTSYSLYYDNVQVGTTQTISDTLGEDIYGFNTYPGNTVGVVTANP